MQNKLEKVRRAKSLSFINADWMSGSLWHCIGSHCNLIVKDGKKYIKRKTWGVYATCFSSVTIKNVIECASFLSFQLKDKRSWKLNRERSHKKSDKPERYMREILCFNSCSHTTFEAFTHRMHFFLCE